MNFTALRDQIRESYRSPEDISARFYIPLLSVACRYDRGVGFFSSTALIEISRGLVRFMNHGGRARIITSPHFTAEDLQAIAAGYGLRQTVEQALIRQWQEPDSRDGRERLNFLAHMVAAGQLDFRVAFRATGLYHEKIGILFDEDGQAVAFSGSLNESSQALSRNFESIDVFTSWHEPTRTARKIEDFNRTWDNQVEQLEVMPFPEVALERLMAYRRDTYDARLDEAHAPGTSAGAGPGAARPWNVPVLPGVALRDYQHQAIAAWLGQGGRGILAMATGSGKTCTALGAVTALHERCHGDLAVVICCPFLHLAEQWAAELARFNIRPVIGHSASPQHDWKERLRRGVRNHNVLHRFMCFLTTNRTLTTPFVQEQLRSIRTRGLLLADEAHYCGALQLMACLPDNLEYRLALSATIERHEDEDGTQALLDYFGGICYEFTLEEAMARGMLTPYRYHPVVVYLTQEELDDYKQLTARIARLAHAAEHSGRSAPSSQGLRALLIRRARLVAGARRKPRALLEAISPHRRERHMLIYCGATSVHASEAAEGQDEDERQVEAVCRLLREQLAMRVMPFTARESARERQDIRDEFEAGSTQALVAIKCLDEGFNLPAVRTAFILASCTNPREYIQRRGRVLRLAAGKEQADIYDFITLPRPLAQTRSLSADERRHEDGLVRRELARMREFNRLASNRVDNERQRLWAMMDACQLRPEDSHDSLS